MMKKVILAVTAMLFLPLSVKAGTFGTGVRVEGIDDHAMAVDREGDRIYVAAGERFSVLDVSDPLSPKILGSVGGIGNRRQVVVKDGMAYLVSRETGLRIIDCTNPEAPRIRSRYDSVEFATGVEVAGGVVFLSERINGVEFVDVSDPDNPAHIAVRKTPESQSVRYRDGYLYSGEWGGASVTVFDAHDMQNIREVGRLNLHGFGDGLEIAGGFLYCSTGHDSRHRTEWLGEEAVGRGRGMDVFSLADPAHPKHVGRVDFPRFKPRNEDFWTVRVSGDMAFCADSHNGLFAVDVHDPVRPTVVDRFCVPQTDHPGWPSAAISSIAVGEGCLYVTASPGGLYVVPVAGAKPESRPKGVLPQNSGHREEYPTDVGEFHVYRPKRPGQARAVTVRGDVAYAAFGDAGLHVLRLRSGGGFEKIGELGCRRAYDCCLCGDRLVTAEGADGFAVYAIEGDAAFREEQRRTSLGGSQDVAFWCWAPDDRTVVLTGRNGGRQFYSISDINRAKPFLTIYGTCQWDKYLADRSVDGMLPDFVPYRGLQWVKRTDAGWKMCAKALSKEGGGRYAAGQTCGVCAFGNGFLVTGDGVSVVDGKRRKRPVITLLDANGAREHVHDLVTTGIPRSDGRFVALNNRSRRTVTVYDFKDASKPRLIRSWRVSGHPDLCAFHDGDVLIPAGHQGLLMSRRRVLDATGGAAAVTHRLQRLLDEKSAKGGGTVSLPKGRYEIGSIFLRSGVTLEVPEGTELVATTDRSLYNAVDVCPQNRTNANESSFGAHLILAIGCRDVGLCGKGRINGNSLAFILDGSGHPWRGGQRGIPWRPSQLLYFVECDGVTVRDLEIADSPYWGCFLHGCRDILVENLDVHNSRDPHTHCADGIDVDCCQDAIIRNCRISTSDDCVTLRANAAPLLRKQDLANVVVSNCTLSSACNAVRLGVGTGGVHDALLRDLVITNSRTAVSIVSAWSPKSRGADVYDVRFENVRVLDAHTFLFADLMHGKNTRIDGIAFSNIVGRTSMPVFIGSGVGRIVFEGCEPPGGVLRAETASGDERAKWLRQNRLATIRLWNLSQDED